MGVARSDDAPRTELNSWPRPQASAPQEGPRIAPQQRDVSLDAARGLAVALMVLANLSAALLKSPPPFWFRCLESIAAPVFILVAGMLVGIQYGHAKASRPAHLFERAGLLLLTAIGVDAVLHGITPGVTCDVLYLFAVALPLTYAFTRLSSSTMKLAIVAAVVGAGELLRRTFGYPADLSDAGDGPLAVMGHWLWHGWFPLFPWLAFAFVGAMFGQWRAQVRAERAAVRVAERWCLVAFVAGLALFSAFPGPTLIRGGYSELFYSPETSFVVLGAATAIGLVLLLDRAAGRWSPTVLVALGEAPLFFYVAHLALGELWLEPWLDELPLPQYLVLYGAIMVVLAGAALLLRRLRKAWPSRPLLVRFFLG